MGEVRRVLLRGRAATSLAICLAVFIPVEAWATSLSMTSDPGDYIGQGLTAGDCGIPATASAVSVNVAAVGAAAAGYLTLYPGDAASPPWRAA